MDWGINWSINKISRGAKSKASGLRKNRFHIESDGGLFLIRLIELIIHR